jgi:RNA polymerase sigma-70 factor (ECF subfamily)
MCVGLLSRNADDARDAVQETALRFLRDLHKFRSDSSIMTWSMGIAINVCREIRRKRRTPMGLVEEIEPSTDTTNPIEDASRDELRSVLHRTLADLPERQREALMLRFFEELSVEQTAAAMSCAEGTVKATVHQALRALRDKLRQLT